MRPNFYRVFSALFAVFILSLGLGPLASQSLDTAKILKDVDNLASFSGGDFSGVYSILSQKPGEEDNFTEVQLYRRDQNDQFVILILKPDVNKGQGYLQIDETVWFYDPESRRFERSSLRDNVSGSDAQNNDFRGSKLSEEYDVTSYSAGKLGSQNVWILDLKAKTTNATYDRVKLWVRQNPTIVLKREDYSVNNRLMRTSLYPKYKDLGGRFVPEQVIIIDEINKGEKSQLDLKSPSVAKIPDSYFSKQFLERAGR